MADGRAPRLIRTASILRAATALVAAIAALAAPGLLPHAPFVARSLRYLLLVFVVTPTALLAAPEDWLRAGARALAPLSRPPVALALFGVAAALQFAPAAVDAGTRSPLLDAVIVAVQLLAAGAAWWGAIVPAGIPGRLREPAAMALLFVLGIPHQIAAGTVATARAALYAGVSIGDQRDGAVLAWVPGGVILWLGITAVWVGWSRAARQADADGPPLSIPGDGAGAPERKRRIPD